MKNVIDKEVNKSFSSAIIIAAAEQHKEQRNRKRWMVVGGLPFYNSLHKRQNKPK